MPTRHDCAAPLFSAQVPVRNLVLQYYYSMYRYSCVHTYQISKWILNLSYEYSILYFSTVRLFINQGSFWVTHCHQKCVNRYIVVHPIGLRRVFSRCVNISTRIFDDNVSFPGLYEGLYKISLTNLKSKFPCITAKVRQII